ncbi:hypothetical protein SAMN02745150_00735 [Brevinema andersonii]|uniref:Activator of Hsp90 ATPase homolog 1-like protein n=1 Tax=Brevinema andersonii TaxID=34097 RepID=A0A1I1DQC1_BREAD|nr:hypothetical protein [Brevinema andersonii]SFB77199.1 hypothetical protein SAMN02745150_00735 [Brevinema andersonii]
MDENIYLELFIPNSSSQEIWNRMIQFPEWLLLFVTPEKIQYQENAKGEWILKKNIFFKTVAQYRIISCQAPDHLLLDIHMQDFSSSILLTLEEKANGTCLHLDHRSFTGKYKNAFRKQFLKRWQKLLKRFSKDQK